jgi:hypothetical protein
VDCVKKKAQFADYVRQRRDGSLVGDELLVRAAGLEFTQQLPLFFF